MLQAIARKWWVLLLRGLGAIALGALIIWWPGVTLLTLVILWGIFALVDGIAGIMLGIRGEADGTMWWTMMLLGVLGVRMAARDLRPPVGRGRVPDPAESGRRGARDHLHPRRLHDRDGGHRGGAFVQGPEFGRCTAVLKSRGLEVRKKRSERCSSDLLTSRPRDLTWAGTSPAS